MNDNPSLPKNTLEYYRILDLDTNDQFIGYSLKQDKLNETISKMTEVYEQTQFQIVFEGDNFVFRKMLNF